MKTINFDQALFLLKHAGGIRWGTSNENQFLSSLGVLWDNRILKGIHLSYVDDDDQIYSTILLKEDNETVQVQGKWLIFKNEENEEVLVTPLFSCKLEEIVNEAETALQAGNKTG